MATTYFVTERYLKDNTTISNNCDVKDVLINVRPVADMYSRSVLGTYFYNDLLTKYNNQTLTPDEAALVSNIQPTIAWKAASESVISLSYQLKNKGIQTQSGDFSSNGEYKEIMFLVHHYSDRADFYLQRLSDYLIENKDLFDAFNSDLNTDSTAKKNCEGGSGNNFQSGIMFI
jgi:hypothetical protein